jgi:DNA uptake protein ComE-like DNA-binding protein
VNTAPKADLLKLPRMTPELADRLIAYRTAKGPITSRDAVRTALRVDDSVFAKMKWYLKATP